MLRQYAKLLRRDERSGKRFRDACCRRRGTGSEDYLFGD